MHGYSQDRQTRDIFDLIIYIAVLADREQTEELAVFDFPSPDEELELTGSAQPDESPITETDRPLPIDDCEDFMREIQKYIPHLKKLWDDNNRDLAFQFLTFLQLLGSGDITTEFFPLMLFLEAAARKGADLNNQRLPMICRLTKLYLTFGYRFVELQL